MKKRAGFTLIELLSVVLIIGILTAVALPQYRRAMQKAKVVEAVSMMRVIYDSAQRLAAGYGYRDFDHFFQSSDGSRFTFDNMDMFDSDTIKCAFAQSGAEMTCDHFTYSITSQEGTSVIQAQSRFSNNNVTLWMVTGSSMPEIECRSSQEICDLYGLYSVQEGE